jgi:hypothetical protein
MPGSLPNPRLWRGLGLTVLLILLGASGGTAQAAVTHEFLGPPITEVPTIGPHGEPVASPGPLQELSGLAVDGDTGALFVPEEFPRSRLDVFDGASGAFAGQIAHVEPGEEGAVLAGGGIAVGHGTGSPVLYTGGSEIVGGEAHGVVGLYSESGASLSVWSGAGTPTGLFLAGGVGDVSVDGSAGAGWQAGDVYVANTTADVIDVFKPGAGGKEEFVTEIKGPEAGVPFTSVSGVAVSGLDGDVYVADAHELVDAFKPTGLTGQYEFTGHLAGPPPTGTFREVRGLGVDPGNGDVYVSEGQYGAVDEFDAAGAYTGRLTGTPSGGFGTVRAVAVDDASHRVFLADQKASHISIDVFGGDVVLPDVETGEPSDVEPESAVLSGSVNPAGASAGAATCEFAWGHSETSLDQVVPCEAGVPEGTATVPVRADLTGLEPDTTYFYRLQANNTNGTNTGEAFQTHSFTTPGPGTRSESVAEINSTAATLQASIDPHGETTRYYFQYTINNTTECNANPAACTTVPAAPGAEIAAGKEPVEVSQSVSALTPATVYHYRVVTVRKAGTAQAETFPGKDETFTTQPAARGNVLPDGRAWEQVSPQDKHGASIQPIAEQGVIQAAETGGAMTYLATSPVEEDAEGNSNKDQILSTRTPAGWSTQTIATPHQAATGAAVGIGQEYKAFSEDLALSAVQPVGGGGPLLSEGASEDTTYLRTNIAEGNLANRCTANCYRPLVTGCPLSGATCKAAVETLADVEPGVVFGGDTKFKAATPDLKHIVLQSTVSLITGDGPGLYEWTAESISYIGASAGEGPPKAVSSDGAKVVFEGTSENVSGLLVRDLAANVTVKLDAVVSGSGQGQPEPEFAGESSDGTKVYFRDTQRLTASSGAGPGNADLYECELVGEGAEEHCALTDLTPATGGVAADVGGVLGVSADGSSVYFAAGGVLAGGGVASPSCPEPGSACNVYVERGGVTSFVATVGAEDSPDWSGAVLSHLTSRVSSDGGWLVFMSDRPLTGLDSRDTVTGRPDEEVFEYHATDRSLVCVSCDPSGARPHGVEYGVLNAQNGGLAGGDRVWAPGQGIAGNVPGWTPYALEKSIYQSRYLSDSGRVFFNSPVGLVSGDGNGMEDVYEFEPLGVGGCSAGGGQFVAAEGGCLGLISGGTSDKESAFLDASGTGGDVFFLTSARLAPSDIDTSADVYDAHECTAASPCMAPFSAVPPPCDTGDSCRAAPSPQPGIFGAPSSATFAGAGNLATGASSAVRPKAKPLTRAQKLAKALKACHKDTRRARRRGCEQQAKKAEKRHKAKK